MSKHTKHRGPDDDGIFIQPTWGLAHRRLSIIDLSDNGRQPMADESRMHVISFNGEVYNFRILREYLEKEGVPFRTATDTEVLLKGYQYWGMAGLLRRVEGMFAFALIDQQRKKLFLARDRFGKKPLYYFQDSRQLLFASDIRAISNEISTLTINDDVINYFLTELSSPQPFTIWNEIHQIPPAHWWEIDLNSGRKIEYRYWRLSFGPKMKIDEREALEETENLLTKAILKRLESDVPVGCFLSGGADSGLVTALLAQHSSKPIRTFSVGFSYEDHNELPLARQLAERYGTNHTELIVEPSIIKDLPQILSAFGEPFADASALPTWYISRAIRREVKVALSGDGGDELFGGYYNYPIAHLADEHMVATRGEGVHSLKRYGYAVLRRAGLSKVNPGLSEHYARMESWKRLYRQMGFTPETDQRLYAPDFPIASRNFAKQYLEKSWNGANQLSLTDSLFEASLNTRLLNDYLVKVDRTSMAHALEVRSPFLDHHLAEFAALLPNHLKLKDGTQKYLLRKLAEKHIDSGFFRRPKKGFGVPLKHWLHDELKGFTSSLLFSQSCRLGSIINRSEIKRIVNEHLQRRDDHTDRIWALICLESWFSYQVQV